MYTVLNRVIQCIYMYMKAQNVLRSSYSKWAMSQISVKFGIQLWLDELQLKIEKIMHLSHLSFKILLNEFLHNG